MYCTNCGEINHIKSYCPWTVCFQCGQNGHMGFACTKPKFHRSKICWTCKRTDHKRGDAKCPGPIGFFCSYCLTDDITTEACPCNGVTTKNLKKENPPAKPVRSRLGEKVSSPKKLEDQQKPTSSRHFEQGDQQNPASGYPKPKTQPKSSSSGFSRPKKDETMIAYCAVSVKIGSARCSALVDPDRRISSINPESIYIKEYNGIDDFVRTCVTIFGIQREITFKTDNYLTSSIILGADALLTFDIKFLVGGRNMTEIDEESAPAIVKSPSPQLSLQNIPYKHPVNLNLADPTDDGVDIHKIPLGEFLEKISDAVDEDSTSSDDGGRKPHPNRRLQY